MRRFSFSKLLLASVLSFGFLSCKKSNDEPTGNRSVKLDDIKSQSGCLSVPAYFANVAQLDPSLPIFMVTTSIGFSSKNLRSNFEKLVAYGALTAENKSLSQLADFRGAEQDECKTLRLAKAGGEFDEYKITQSSASMVRAEKESGEFVQYHWISPQSIEVETRAVSFDVPCTKDTQVFVQIKKVLDWSGNAPDTIDESSAMWIEPRFLELAAAATGTDVTRVYEGDGSSRRIVVSRVQELVRTAPLAEVVACTDPNRPPSQPVDPPTDPADPGNPLDPGPTPTPVPPFDPAPTDPGPTPTPAFPGDSDNPDENEMPHTVWPGGHP